LADCPGLEFIIDGTERPISRPKDKKRQESHYSGKKKQHTVKNNVVSDKRTRKIKVLSETTELPKGKELTAEQKEQNRQISRERIRVERSIAWRQSRWDRGRRL
jgi:hypothetical protein